MTHTTNESRDQALQVEIINGRLVISVGVDALAFGCEFGNPNNQDDSFYISDKDAFAKEMLNMLQSEEEDGTTLVHRMFDEATDQVIENGGLGIELREDR